MNPFDLVDKNLSAQMQLRRLPIPFFDQTDDETDNESDFELQFNFNSYMLKIEQNQIVKIQNYYDLM